MHLDYLLPSAEPTHRTRGDSHTHFGVRDEQKLAGATRAPWHPNALALARHMTWRLALPVGDSWMAFEITRDGMSPFETAVINYRGQEAHCARH